MRLRLKKNRTAGLTSTCVTHPYLPKTQALGQQMSIEYGEHLSSRSQSAVAERLVGLVVKAPASTATYPGLDPRLRRDFSGSSHTNDLKLAFQWLPCQAPGVIGSVLGLVGPVSVNCDWVRRRVGSANFYLSVAACKLV